MALSFGSLLGTSKLLSSSPFAPIQSFKVPPVLPNGNFPFHETLLSALPALPGVLPGVPGMPGMPLLAPVLSTMPGGPKEPLPFDDVKVPEWVFVEKGMRHCMKQKSNLVSL